MVSTALDALKAMPFASNEFFADFPARKMKAWQDIIEELHETGVTTKDRNSKAILSALKREYERACTKTVREIAIPPESAALIILSSHR